MLNRNRLARQPVTTSSPTDSPCRVVVTLPNGSEASNYPVRFPRHGGDDTMARMVDSLAPNWPADPTGVMSDREWYSAVAYRDAVQKEADRFRSATV